MAKKQKGSRFHPARISGHQKFLRAKQANEELEKERKRKEKLKKTKPIDMSKSDWSLRN